MWLINRWRSGVKIEEEDCKPLNQDVNDAGFKKYTNKGGYALVC